MERAGGHCTGPYRVPAIDMESLSVYTNNPPCGAMRGFGANQAAFAIEGLLDRLAELVGIDGYDILVERDGDHVKVAEGTRKGEDPIDVRFEPGAVSAVRVVAKSGSGTRTGVTEIEVYAE